MAIGYGRDERDGRRLDWLAKEESMWREHLTRGLTDLREPAICKTGEGEITLRGALLPMWLEAQTVKER